MSNNAITHHYWDNKTQVIQPPKAADKPREERRQSFAAILKAQTTKGERRVIVFVVIWLLLVVGVQIGIATGPIHGPVYLADFIGG